MATKESTKNISVLRKRDYSKVFQWNASLNEDLYYFYLKARENPQQGYMRRLKSLWMKNTQLTIISVKNTYVNKLHVSLEIIPKLQQKALIGSMRVIKSALSMKD